MGNQGSFDLVLFGYRNDIARERVLEYLAALAPRGEGQPRIERATPLPTRVFAQLPLRRAQELQWALERLGAQMVLVPLSQPIPGDVPVARSSRIPALTSLLFICLAALVGVWMALTLTIRSTQKPLVTKTTLPAPAPAQVLSFEPTDKSIANDEFAAMQHNGAAVALANKGRLQAAAEQLRQALRFAPEHPIISKNLQTVLLNWGLHELKEGRSSMALARLHEALAIGERGDIRRALGFVHLQTGDYVEARADLERAIEAGSEDAWTWMALGQTHLWMKDRARALDALQSAREAGATDPQLDAFLARLSREVDAEWDFTALESESFRVTFAEGENSTAALLVLDGLEEARHVVGQRFGYFPDHATDVVLYAADAFHVVTQTPDWAGAAYDGRIKLPVGGLEADEPNLARVLRHEYMHSLVAALSDQRCPAWLNEGLAVWAEEEQDGERIPWALDLLHDASLFRLKEIEGSLITSLGLPRAHVAYAQSYLAVRQLIDRYGARTLPTFLEALGRQPLAAAFATVYSEDLAEFEERLLRSVGG